MTTILRGSSVDYNATADLNSSVGWFNFTVPGDYVSGQNITFRVVGGILADSAAPTSMDMFISGGIVTVNGGVVGAGPYSVSGHSYQIGVETKQGVFTTSSDFTTIGLNQSTGTSWHSNNANAHADTLVDGTPTYAGEGMFPHSPNPIGPVGWFPNAQDGHGASGGTVFTAGDTVSVYMVVWCESDDSVNDTRTIYPVIQSITVEYGAHTIPIALTDVFGGFNTGGTAVPNTQGAQTYNAWAGATLGAKPHATDHQDLFLEEHSVLAFQPYRIQVGLIPARVGSGGASLG